VRFASLASACALLLAGCAADERTQLSRAGIAPADILHPANLSDSDAERIVAQAIVAHEIRRP
jgi:Flp pilus assembly protein TadD